MAHKTNWTPLIEILKTKDFDELLKALRNGTIKARGNFETDQMYQDKEDGRV